MLPKKNLKSFFSFLLPACSSGRQGEAGGKGVRGEIPPAEPIARKISSPRTNLLRKFYGVKIFSNTHRSSVGSGRAWQAPPPACRAILEFTLSAAEGLYLRPHLFFARATFSPEGRERNYF